MFNLKHLAMQVITIDSEAYRYLLSRLDKFEKRYEEIVKKAMLPLGERWLDVQDVCMELKISKRTLAYYRTKGIIPHAILKHKVYFRASDINKFLMDNFQQGSFLIEEE